MSVSQAYRPKLPDAYLREEHAYFVEAGFEAVVYGMTFTLYVFTLRAFYKRRHLSPRSRTRSPSFSNTKPRSSLSRLSNKYLSFLSSPSSPTSSLFRSPSTPLLLFLTLHHLTLLLAVALNIDYIARSFVYNRRIPGGPVVYQQRYGTLPGAYAALVGWMGGAWGEGGMALYRCFTIWGDTSVVWFTVPIFMYGISVALSTLLLLRLPHPTLLPSLAMPFGIPLPLFYFGLNVCFTCVVCGLITFRLVRHRRAVAGSVRDYHTARTTPTTTNRRRTTTSPRSRALAQAQQATSPIAILTDSALPYALVGIVQVVSMRTDAPVATGVEGLYGAMAALSSHMIAYRLATGQAFTPNTLAVLQSQSNPSHASNTYSRLEARDKSLDADLVFDAEMGDEIDSEDGEADDEEIGEGEMGDGDSEMTAFLREEGGEETMILPVLGRG